MKSLYFLFFINRESFYFNNFMNYLIKYLMISWLIFINCIRYIMFLKHFNYILPILCYNYFSYFYFKDKLSNNLNVIINLI